MITQSFVVGFLGKTSENSSGVKKSETKNSGSYPSFIDSLNSSVEKNYAGNSNRNVQRSADLIVGMRKDKQNVKPAELSSGAVETESDNKIKSYKEAVKEHGQLTEKKKVTISKGKTADKNENIEKTSEQETEKIEETLIEESLAQILNISVEELKKIMSTLNISPEELCDASKTAEIAGKISDMFGLDTEQKATLIKITEVTLKESKSRVNALEIQDNMENEGTNKEGWIELEGIDVEVVETDKKVKHPGIEVFESKLKEVLNNLTDKLENEPEKLFEEITQTVEGIMPKDLKTVNGKSTMETESVKEVNLTPTENKDLKTSQDSDKSGENKEELLSDKEAEAPDIQKAQPENTLKTNTEGVDQSRFNNILNNQQIKTGATAEVSEVKSEVTVSKKEIISQIVEKAKVILTDEKSEMVIDLKPDHLGKLSLKIVTERGNVMAKFVAENEQVKAAIESNMDSLKESLTKQGFSVQGFSVSVGQESRKGFNESYRFSKNNNKSDEGEKVMASVVGGVSVLEENQLRLNPYMVNNSSIDLTA